MRVLKLIFICFFFLHCQNIKEINSKQIQAELDPPILSYKFEDKIEIVPLLDGFEKENIQLPVEFLSKKQKNYLGVNTRKIFKIFIENFKIQSSEYDIRFYCKDGYSPTIPLYQLLEGNGYFVVKELNSSNQTAKDLKAEFSPVYLVWDVPLDDHFHSFPYGIKHFQFIKKDHQYAKAIPISNSKDIIQGFMLFKDNCIKCHSVNLEGGTMGPELNIPMNITEYWKIEQLKRFIKAPSLFRENSKMPQLDNLNNEQLDLLIKYLQFMSNQKFKMK